jgi:hypothetical protein
MLEQERWAAGLVPPPFAWRRGRGVRGSIAFTYTVGDFGDFQDRVYFGLDAL